MTEEFEEPRAVETRLREELGALPLTGRRMCGAVQIEFPGGRRVVSNTTLELREGRVVRKHTVASGDS